MNHPELLTLSGTALAALIRNGDLTSVDAVDAHIAQVEATNPTLNAVVATRFEEAREEAQKADAKRAKSNADLPAFHGVPCTIKECFALTGMPNTAGLATRVPLGGAAKDATAVARLRAAGAIPLGVTNTSELCMWMESANTVYGRTNNAYDPTRIVGGSSGGEGAIISAGASPFGLGSDIGGSIRLPAFFNGVFGHKPSGGMVPGTGQFPLAENEALRYLTTGPLARRAEDLMPLMRILAGPDGQDGGCTPIPLQHNADISLDGLRVVTIEHNGFRRVSKDLLDTQRRAADALRDRGAIVEVAHVKALKRSFELWATLLGEAEEHQSFRGMLESGAPRSMVLELARFAMGRSDHTLPAIVLAAVEKVSPYVSGSPAKAFARVAALKTELNALIGDGVMLFPSYTRVAPLHNRPLLTPLDFVYAGILNVLEMPATQVPMGLSAEGLPLGIQVASVHGADHRTIRVAQALEDACGGWVPPAMVPQTNTTQHQAPTHA